MRVTGEDPHTADPSPAAPDWRRDPRELADAVGRRASRRRRSRIGAAVAAVLLVVAGGWFLGFVTGRFAIPGLGTLTPLPADVSTFTVGDATYLMQVGGPGQDTVVVTQAEQDGGIHNEWRVAGLPVPGPDAVSVAAVPIPRGTPEPARSTYVAVLPPGAHDVKAVPNDLHLSVTSYEGAVRTSRPDSPLLGVVVTLDRPDGTPQSLTQPGLASIRWTDVDRHVHVSPVAP